MAITFVQKAPNTTAPVNGSGTSVSTGNFPSDVTVGNVIVAVATFYDAGGATPTISFSDSKGNTWYLDKVIGKVDAYDGYIGVAIGHCAVSTGGSGFYVTVSSTVTCEDLNPGACEYSGIDTSLTAGGSANNSGTGNSSNASSGLVTVGSGNFLFMGGTAWVETGSGTEGAGWTERHYQSGGATRVGHSSEEKITTGNQTATWTVTNGDWAAACVAYVEASGGTTYYASGNATATSTPAVIIQINISRNVQAIGVIGLLKQVNLIRSIQATGVVVATEGIVFLVNAAVTVIGVLTHAAIFIAGSPAGIFNYITFMRRRGRV